MKIHLNVVAVASSYLLMTRSNILKIRTASNKCQTLRARKLKINVFMQKWCFYVTVIFKFRINFTFYCSVFNFGLTAMIITIEIKYRYLRHTQELLSPYHILRNWFLIFYIYSFCKQYFTTQTASAAGALHGAETTSFHFLTWSSRFVWITPRSLNAASDELAVCVQKPGNQINQNLKYHIKKEEEIKQCVDFFCERLLC